MAYENYSFVSWSDGTPLSGERLAQMSMNMEQIRDANDNKPAGIIKYIELTSGGISNVVSTSNQIIQLTNPQDGVDSRVSVAANRYIKVTCNFPGFTIQGKGAEDSTLFLKIYQVATNFDAAVSKSNWEFSPPPFGFYNTALNAATTATSVRGDYSTIGDGTYSYVFANGAAQTQLSFSVVVYRAFGTSGATNAPQIGVTPTATEKLQLYVEDIGGGT